MTEDNGRHPRRSSRRATASPSCRLVRGTRAGTRSARAGHAPARRSDRPRPGRVPHDPPARRHVRKTGRPISTQPSATRPSAPSSRRSAATTRSRSSRTWMRGLARADPKPFFGYSDNTSLLNWLWSLGISGYYGGSTQVHLGAGPRIDDVHLASLKAALFTGGEAGAHRAGRVGGLRTRLADAAGPRRVRRARTRRALGRGRAGTRGRRPHLGRVPGSHRPAGDRRTSAVRRRAEGEHPAPRDQRRASARLRG